MIYIHLYHGRKAPDQEMNDWGEDGPVIGPFDWFHGTYFSTFNFGTTEHGTIWWLGDNKGFPEGLIYYDGMYYGDFEIVSIDDRKLVIHAEPFNKKRAGIE